MFFLFIIQYIFSSWALRIETCENVKIGIIWSNFVKLSSKNFCVWVHLSQSVNLHQNNFRNQELLEESHESGKRNFMILAKSWTFSVYIKSFKNSSRSKYPSGSDLNWLSSKYPHEFPNLCNRTCDEGVWKINKNPSFKSGQNEAQIVELLS